MIIGLLGFIDSGKGTASDIIRDMGYEKIAFADSVKDAVSVLFGWDRGMLEGDTVISRKLREQPDQYWSEKFGEEITPRNMLQRFGTEVCRDTLLQTIWINCFELKASRNKDKNIVVPDVRFNNEIEVLKSMGACLIRVHRSSAVPAWFEKYKTYTAAGDMSLWERYAEQNNIHSSEYQWIDNPLIDYTIENDGTVSDLRTALHEILELKPVRK